MANPITQEIKIGKVGELFIQLRFLQYNVQAAPPLVDSGNDLIALKNFAIRCIQVKTTITDTFPSWPEERKRSYHILAIVQLSGEERQLYLDESKIYLLTKEEYCQCNHSWANLSDFEISEDRINVLFQE